MFQLNRSSKVVELADQNVTFQVSLVNNLSLLVVNLENVAFPYALPDLIINYLYYNWAVGHIFMIKASLHNFYEAYTS